MPKLPLLAPRALVAYAAAALALAAPAAARQREPLYQWTDAAGAVRYTTQIERIPVERRGAAVIVAGAHDAPSAEKRPSGAPAAEPAPPPVGTAPAPAAPVDEKVAALDAQIAELEKRIAADEAVLADYISDPERAKRPPGSDDIAAIADRVPKLQNELRQLREQRAAAAGAAAPNAP